MNKLKLMMALLIALSMPMAQSTPTPTPTPAPKETLVTLEADNVIVLNDEVNGESVAKVVEKARELDAKFDLKETLTRTKRPLYLFLNTPGGSIQAGLELIEQLKPLGRPIHTVTLFAASMGFQIAQQLGDRLVLKNGVLMSHRAYGGFEGAFGGQSPSPIEGIYGLWMTRLTEMDQKTVERSNGKQTLESYQRQYAPDMWRTGTQAVDEGYADKVVQVACGESLKGTTKHQIMYMGMIPVSYELSNCPMNTTPMNIKIDIPTTEGLMSVEKFQKVKGGFGYACLKASVNTSQVCATDLNLTFERIRQIPSEFKSSFEAKQRTVIRMRVGY